jgi:hypothetical protein
MTALAGAAPAADVPGSSPAPMDTTAARVAFLDSLAATPEEVELPPLPDDASPSTDVEAEAEETAEPEAGKDAEEAPKGEEKAIPFAAFQKRLGRETAKTRAAEEKAQAAHLDSLRLKGALELLHAEYDAFKTALLEAGVDPRDLQLRHHEMLKLAGEQDAKVSLEHKAAIEQAAKAAEHEAVKATLREEMGEACQANPLVSYAELKAAMWEAQSTDAAAVAAKLQAEKIAIARKHLAPAKPAHPRTVKAGAAGTMPRIDTSTKGLEELLTRITATG